MFKGNTDTLKPSNKTIFNFFSYVAVGYLFINLALFRFFAPSKMTVLGIKVSISSFNRPFRIFLFLILVGLFIKFFSKRPYRLDQRSIIASIFCIVFLAHLGCRLMISADSRWSIPTARSIIKQGNTDLNEYGDIIEAKDYRVEKINGHFYSIFPIGASIISLPFVLFINDKVITTSYSEIEWVIACFIIALTSIFIYLIAFSALQSLIYSFLLVFIFAFCTSALSIASRGLWQHGPSMLMLSITLLLIILSERRPAIISFVGIPLMFSFVIRPTNAISILFLTILILFKYRKYFFSYLLWSAAIIIPFLFYNFHVYHSLLSPYYMPQRVFNPKNFIEAGIGNLLSPARGLLVFSPIFMFCFYGIYIKIKNKEKNALDCSLIAIVVVHWIVISTFPKWWGGHCFGPRFFADMAPFFIYFLLPIVKKIPRLEGIKKYCFAILFICLTITSSLIHYRGATSFECYRWNAYPTNIDYDTRRLWDWHDLQFLRRIRLLHNKRRNGDPNFGYLSG